MSYESVEERRNRETIRRIESQVAENNDLIAEKLGIPKGKRLAQKIFKISREAGAVERKGVGQNNGNESRPLYAYPRIEDVLDVVQPLLNKYKLIATGSVVKEPVTHVIRGGAATTEILVEWTLEDSDTGESRTWRIPGSGSDEQGKGSYRALTGSRKYFYVIAFNLKFGDEPEEVQRAAQPEATDKRSE